MRFPLFVDLTEKRVVVVGGGAVGCRRAGVLRDFGARVTLVAPQVGELPDGVEWIPRPYQAGDLEGAFLALAATDCPQVNGEVVQEARSRGIPVNRSDDPQSCDFFFPAICLGEGIVAGVVGDGSDHHRTARAARAIRKGLEECL